MDSSLSSTKFTARVGCKSYDAVRFSSQPQAALVGSSATGLAVVRHFGVHGDGAARSSSGPAAVDTLILHCSSFGRYRGRVGDEPVDRQLVRGTVSFVPRAMPVDIEYPATNHVVLMMLPPVLVDAALADLGGTSPRTMHGERNQRLAQLFALIEGELAAPGFASDLLLDGLTRALIAALARKDVEVPASERLHLSPVRLRRAVEFIDAELGRNICLREIAAAAGLSPFHFSRVFKLTTGETPYQFLARAGLTGPAGCCGTATWRWPSWRFAAALPASRTSLPRSPSRSAYPLAATAVSIGPDRAATKQFADIRGFVRNTTVAPLTISR